MKIPSPTAQPVAAPIPVDPEQQAALTAEHQQVQADLAGLKAAEDEARKQEAAIIAQADR